jgi:hypothetical protein
MRRQQTQLGEFFNKEDDPVLIASKCIDSTYLIEYYNPTMEKLGCVSDKDAQREFLTSKLL